MTLDVSIMRDDELLVGIHWDQWVLTVLALAKALDDDVITEAEKEFVSKAEDSVNKVNKFLEENADLPTTLLDDTANLIHGMCDTVWQRVWNNWWDKDKWFRGEHTVLSDYEFTNPMDKDFMGIKAQQKLALKKGDKIWTNIG